MQSPTFWLRQLSLLSFITADASDGSGQSLGVNATPRLFLCA